MEVKVQYITKSEPQYDKKGNQKETNKQTANKQTNNNKMKKQNQQPKLTSDLKNNNVCKAVFSVFVHLLYLLKLFFFFN